MFNFFKKKPQPEKPSVPVIPALSETPAPSTTPTLPEKTSALEKPASPAMSPPSEAEIMDAVAKAVKGAFQTQNPEIILKVLKETYAAHCESEGPAGWIVGAIGERGVVPLFDLLADFVNRFPQSLYSARVLLADFMASRDDFDEAAFHARFYLRLARDGGKFPQLGQLRIIKDGVSRALALLFPAYALVGAKSYAQRVLRFAGTLDLDADWKEDFEKQIAGLELELADPAVKALDDKWEAFFKSASNVTELYKLCGEKGFPMMADRVDLIEGFFRTRRGYTVDAEEMFLLVTKFAMENGDTANALV